jgi:RecB family endonuclease NucS
MTQRYTEKARRYTEEKRGILAEGMTQRCTEKAQRYTEKKEVSFVKLRKKIQDSA